MRKEREASLAASVPNIPSAVLMLLKEQGKQEEWRANTCASKNLTCWMHRKCLERSFNSRIPCSFRETAAGDMLSNVWRLPTCMFEVRWVNGRQWGILIMLIFLSSSCCMLLSAYNIEIYKFSVCDRGIWGILYSVTPQRLSAIIV